MSTDNLVRFKGDLRVPSGQIIQEDSNVDTTVLRDALTLVNCMSMREKAHMWRHIRSQFTNPELTPEEFANAQRSLTGVYPIRIVNPAVWPVDSNQRLGLIAFVPAAGATPNGDGIYGLIRVHNNRSSQEEQDSQVDEIIQKADSRFRMCVVNVHKWEPLVSQHDQSAWAMTTRKSETSNDSKERQVASLHNEYIRAGQKVYEEARESVDRENDRRRDELKTQLESMQTLDIGEDGLADGQPVMRIRKKDEPVSNRYVRLRIDRANIRYNKQKLSEESNKYQSYIDKVSEEIRELEKEDESLLDNFKDHLKTAMGEVEHLAEGIKKYL